MVKKTDDEINIPEKEITAEDLLTKLKKDMASLPKKSTPGAGVKTNYNAPAVKNISEKKENRTQPAEPSPSVSDELSELSGEDDVGLSELMKRYFPNGIPGEDSSDDTDSDEAELELNDIDGIDEAEIDDIVAESVFETSADDTDETIEAVEMAAADELEEALEAASDDDEAQSMKPFELFEQIENLGRIDPEPDLAPHYEDYPKAENPELAPADSEDIDLSSRIKDAEEYINEMAKDEHTNAPDNVDETDIKIMMALGMDDELKSTVDEEKINEVERKIEEEEAAAPQPIREEDGRKKEIEEFTDRAQSREIIARLRKEYRGILIRLGLSALLMLIAMIFELIPAFGGSLPDAMNPAMYPVVSVMAALQISMLGGALIYKELIKGAKSIAALQPEPESASLVVIGFSVIYYVATVISGASAEIKMYSFPVILCVVMTLIYELISTRRSILSFKIAASQRPKYAISDASGLGNEAIAEAFDTIAASNPSTYSIEKAQFVDGFFRRSADYSSAKLPLIVLLPVCVLIAIIFVIFGAIRGGAYSGIRSGFVSLLMTMPTSLFLSYSLPMSKACKAAGSTDSAIIGDRAVEEYASTAIVSFDDKDVFPAYGVKVRSMKIYGENRVDHVLLNLARLFRKLGGPLSEVFEIATVDFSDGTDAEAEIVDIARDGIETVVGEAHMLVGKASYLRRNRFAPVYDNDDEEIENAGMLNIMYVVVNNEVAAKLYIQYQIDPDFGALLKQLYKSNKCVGIRTFDPNIDDRMLASRIETSKYPIRVIKCRDQNDIAESVERVDSGIISKKSPKALLQTLALCDRVQEIIRTNLLLKAAAVLIGAFIMAFVLILNNLPGMSSFYIVIYQLFWMIPIVLITKLFM